MALQAETKDCTGLSDSELSEMADICADGSAGYDVGILSKPGAEWGLGAQVRDGGRAGARCGAATGAAGPPGYAGGILSKQVEEWVLVTQVRDGVKLSAFSFCTL